MRGARRGVARGLRRLGRALGLGRNAMRRRSDRIEGAVLGVAIVAMCLAVPLAVATGVRVTDDRARHLDRAHTAPAVAVLLADAPATGAVATVPTVASWSTATGRRTGVVAASPGLRRGSRVRIRVDAAGREVAAAPGPRSAPVTGVAAGLGVLLASLALVAALRRGVRRRLDRTRIAAWERDWRRTGPRWTHR